VYIMNGAHQLGGAVMSGTVELVLAVEAKAASEWMAGPSASRHRGRAAHHSGASASRSTVSTTIERGSGGGGTAHEQAHADTGAAIADALSRNPGIEALSAFERSTVRAFIECGGALRVTLAAGADGVSCLTAARATELTPGVWRCETVCEEPLKAGTSLALSDVIPQGFKDVLGKPDKLAPTPALAVRRGVWRWSGPDGAVVDIELHDARSAFECAGGAAAESSEGAPSTPAATASSSEHGAMPVAFCELRLAARIDAAHAASDTVTSPAAPTGKRSDEAHTSSTSHDAKEDARLAALRALFAAAGALADTLPVFPTLTDGYERASCTPSAGEVPVRAAHIDLSGVKTPHGALISAGANVARQWLGNEAGVRDSVDGTEFIHQMRVALRRLKTLLKTFPRWADDTWKLAIAPEVEWLGGLLGDARDLDVFADTTLPALAAADIDAAVWAPLQKRAAARRDEARAKVHAALRTRRYAALCLAWLHWLAAQRCTPGPSVMIDKALADYAAKRVRKHYRRLLGKRELTALTPAERHRRRIEAKRLRYTLEFFEPLASRKTRRKVAKQLGRIQSVLGDGSDATSALLFLEALDVPPYEHGFARGWCEAVNRWSAIEGERLLQALDKPKIMRAP
jgi:CHAD domain-containing protein